MTEAGMLSIVRCGHTYQVRYASANPYDVDQPAYLCPDEDAMITLLHHYEIDAWSLDQTIAVLRKESMAVLLLVVTEAERQTYFPPQRPPRVYVDAGDT